MAIALLDVVEKALHVVKQALGNHAGKPDSGGLPREAHIVAHCIRNEEDHTFTELVDRLGLMPEVCDRLGIHTEALPDPTTFYHSLDRYAMSVLPERVERELPERHEIVTFCMIRRSVSAAAAE